MRGDVIFHSLSVPYGDPGTCAFVLPFPLLDAPSRSGWLSAVWVTCSVSQGWTRWPCAGKWQAFRAGSPRRKRPLHCCPKAQTLSAVRREFYSQVLVYFRLLACWVTFYCCFSNMQRLLALRPFVYFQPFCTFAQSQLLIKINRLTEELRKTNALNYRKVKHSVDRGEEMFVLMSDT